MKKSVAVLLTCHNRKSKTIECMEALNNCELPDNFYFDVFLVDDGSTDGTATALKKMFKNINIIKGNGKLFWAGGMRKAWKNAIDSSKNFDFFLLLNDDTILFKNALKIIFKDLKSTGNENSIIVGSTIDPDTKEISYGGHKLLYENNIKSELLLPNEKFPQKCDLGNANIMLVPNSVFEKLGMLSKSYTHGIADYDYTLRAKKANIGTFLASKYCGVCKNDHGVNWMNKKNSLKRRIEYLYSPKGLSYKEYLFFIRSHFPAHLPMAYFKLWMKTVFPGLWDKYKKID